MLNLSQVAFGLDRYVLGATDSRMGVWVQGCSLACTGCASLHTWAPSRGKWARIDRLIQLAQQQGIPPTGLTISGGEPTAQSVAVLGLVRAFRAAYPSTEVILYTGLSWDQFRDEHEQLMACLDVVVAGPYDNRFPPTSLSGSANQQVRLLTALGRRLYSDWRTWPIHTQQVAASSANSVVTVGIPDTPRMTRAADTTSARRVTWQRNSKNTSRNHMEIIHSE